MEQQGQQVQGVALTLLVTLMSLLFDTRILTKAICVLSEAVQYTTGTYGVTKITLLRCKDTNERTRDCSGGESDSAS